MFEWLARALYPEPEVLAAGLAVGLMLDLAYPEHRGLALKLHPVHTSYIMALRLVRPGAGRAWGAAIWLLTISSHMMVYASLLAASYLVHPALHTLAVGVIVKLSMPLRLLLDTCIKASRMAAAGRVECSRRLVQGIVRRDLSGEPLGRVLSACIESTAESLVDGYTSPLTYYILLGPLGALLQRLSNTLDGAVGFKTPLLYRQGWFSAKADTLLNFIPARLTAVMVALAAPLAGASTLGSLRCIARCARLLESVNAGYPISAFAGALDVRLEKKGFYIVNGGAPYPGWRDGLKASRLAVSAASLYTVLAALAIALGGGAG
ncbi:cobalamin biosynthesis protein CbiB [Aeropyrum pernix K1]|uniref:Probable cobalamin biosynthesis protein CobD n=1 Tax=Aeropyrum pernix (strain ATCC 700893 / DSM 11879 / JCM 9820 / NBRC 100138 / K1) TaxID=272557 RepID=COBD_AERPE|nr:cobalamin biosynthesis protein [Aeropyrum pernix]Q9YAA0.2 RecName: Full=Probable cobalamin biosynthesis protein CobD [Aeropyrum pernix K1]BAA81049.2 cobalamin biosynthesis protein CbiB [Aeropyrum pernix K1]